MARPSKVVQLDLEAEALASRENGLTLDATVERLNALLAVRGTEATVSRSAVARYIGTLDATTVAAAHSPQIAPENAALSIGIGRHVLSTIATLDEHLVIAEAERDRSGNRRWGAVLSIMAEQRKQTALYVDMIDVICSIDNVARFQADVLAAIGAADSDTEARIRASLTQRHALRCAQLLSS